MKGWLPLAVGGIAVAACTDTTIPRRPPNAQAPQLLEQQGPSPQNNLSPLVIVTVLHAHRNGPRARARDRYAVNHWHSGSKADPLRFGTPTRRVHSGQRIRNPLSTCNAMR